MVGWSEDGDDKAGNDGVEGEVDGEAKGDDSESIGAAGMVEPSRRARIIWCQ